MNLLTWSRTRHHANTPCVVLPFWAARCIKFLSLGWMFVAKPAEIKFFLPHCFISCTWNPWPYQWATVLSNWNEVQAFTFRCQKCCEAIEMCIHTVLKLRVRTHKKKHKSTEWCYLPFSVDNHCDTLCHFDRGTCLIWHPFGLPDNGHDLPISWLKTTIRLIRSNTFEKRLTHRWVTSLLVLVVCWCVFC